VTIEPSPGQKRAGIRIGLYYAVLLGLAALLLWKFPGVSDLFLYTDPGEAAGVGELTSTFSADVPPSVDAPEGWDSVLVTAVSILGALLIMIPVAMSYILIKRDSGYEESVVHTLLILPMVVTGILIVVKASLALAFSLAGIVAAVRFRTTLNDTKDAVYVFLSIGVGLAAGVQALGVAFTLALLFNVVNLLLWRMNFGNIYADQIHRTGGLGLGTAIAGPGSSATAVKFGPTTVMTASGPSSLGEVEAAQARIRRYLRQESRDRREQKQYQALIVYTHAPARVKGIVEPVLNERCRRWHLAEVSGTDNDVSAMTYLVRLKDGFTEGHLLSTLRESDSVGEKLVEAAEVRSLKALADKKTKG
jgi:hypothetical protein